MKARPWPATAPGITRRQMLAALLLVPPALAGCSVGIGAQRGPDPLVELADAARSDAALAAAVIMSTPALAARVQPVLDARTAHAQALDAEVARLAPERTSPSLSPPGLSQATLPQVRAAVVASAQKAAALVPTLPAERVGLVASVAACCSAYGQVLL